MTTNGTPWRANSRGDDLAHAAEPAEDEMVVEVIEHAREPSALPPLGQRPLGEQRHEERERVKERAHARKQDDDREGPARRRQRMDLAVAHGRDRDRPSCRRRPTRSSLR